MNYVTNYHSLITMDDDNYISHFKISINTNYTISRII